MAAWKPGDEHEWNVCCNCAPRLIYARFVPDDLDGDCCITAGVPMWHGVGDLDVVDDFHSVYRGTLFSIGINIELGQVGDDYGEECGWKIALERKDHAFLPDVDHSSIVPIDHDAVTCLEVPAISVACTGPDGCEGTLSLENVPIAKLPYIEREDVVAFESHRPLPEYDPECQDAYGLPADIPECDPEFYDLDPPCGHPAVLVDGERWLEDLPQYQWDDSETARSVYWSMDFERWVIGEEYAEPVAYGPADYADGEPYGVYFDDPDCTTEEECPYAETVEVSLDPYGQCVQVCSRLQERRVNREIPWNCMEWRWFDDSYVDPYSSELVLVRGWRIIDPRTDIEETLLLEEDPERRCQVRSDTGSALIEVVGGCSCALVVSLAIGGSSAQFKCGFCQRWDYFCGTCRCIPAELCVAFFDGEAFYPNLILTWDEVERRWGDAYDLLQIAITKDEVLGCVITPVLSFEWTPPKSPVVHDCGDEFTWEGKQIQSTSYILNADFQGTRDVYGEEMPVSISIGSLVPHCDVGPCPNLPCDDRCKSNPKSVTATIEVFFYELLYEELPYSEELGNAYINPYNSGYCSFSVELYYERQVTALGPGGGFEVGCGYEGWYLPGGVDCGVYHITYTMGRIVIQFLGQDATTDDAMIVEECDPFYASTSEDDPVSETPEGWFNSEHWPHFPQGSGANIRRCLGCPEWATVLYRVVITE